jgi:acyl transferase domain-containing protein/thioesterase domain-containing protein
VSGADREQLLGGLAALAAGEDADNVSLGAGAEAGSSSGPVFLFPGQGAQWRSMAIELLGSSPEFARAIDECEQALEPHVEWSLASVLRREEGTPDLEKIDVVQPVLFATMVSLAALWRSCGVEPAAVVGHSQGEIAAAHVAGGLSLEDAARLVALRSQVLTLGTGQGAMALVATGADELTARVPDWRELVSLGGVNGPSSVVVSGDNDGIEEVLARCEEAGIWTHRIRAAVGAGHSPAIEPGRELLMEAAAGISPGSCEVPFYSCVTAGPLDTAALDAEYWYRNARETVLFGPTVARLLDEGFRRFVEVSPNPILMMPVLEAIAHQGETGRSSASFTPTLRRHHGGLDDFALAVGTAWANGIAVDWDRALPPGRKRLSLPTYPFQRQHYWAPAPATGPGDASASGQEPADHPLLAAVVRPAEGGSWIFTGRISLETHPWLADHGGMGVVLVPGTAFVELALHAGAEVGCDLLRELSLEAPLPLPESGAVQIQLTLSEPDEEGRCSVTLHSRPEAGADGEAGEWTRHATGLLAPGEAGDRGGDRDGAEWPPAGAEAVDVGSFYADLAALGFEYGPAFQGLKAAWRRGEEVFVELALDGAEAGAAASFGLHPALLDAALHASGIFFVGEGARDLSGPQLPFAFTDVSLRTTGLSRLRAILSLDDGGAVAVRAFAESGEPVAAVGSLLLRPVPRQYFAAPEGTGDALFALEWPAAELPSAPADLALVGAATTLAGERAESPRSPDLAALAAAIDAGAAVPEVTAYAVAAAELAPADGTVAALHANAAEVMDVVQNWLGDERFANARLTVLTAGAVAARDGDPVPNLGQAPVWGLLRSAQAEHPGRLGLLDVDDSAASREALPRALASEEPQLALREGEALVPRLRRLAGEPAQAAASIDPEGTLLVTGGTGDLGGLVAGHFVESHGIRRVLLASRSGAEAEGAAELVASLESRGAQVRVAACDVGDREQLAELIASIDAAHPLTAVVHCAMVLDDGIFAALTPERLDRVLAAKADAAWHLHELTEGMELGAFVLFSSLAGAAGSPGQANYAAANVFLDALAAHRAARGLAATSVAWGLWERTLVRGEAALDGQEVALVGRSGLAPIADRQGLELLDAALALERPTVTAARLNLAVWRLRGEAEAPPIMRELVRPASGRAVRGDRGESLVRLLASVPEQERLDTALEFVRRQLADVLGYASAVEIDAERPFLELGFDSLIALQYRNRLNASTGLNLMPSVALDHPTPAALAEHLLDQLEVDGTAAAGAAAGQTLASLLRSAHDDGRAPEFLELVRDMAAFRPAFSDPDGAERYALRLAAGPALPPLVCVPSAAPISGPHEYARVAQAFRDVREVWALRWPGFAAAEALPESCEAAVELQVAALREQVGSEPAVLVGHSTGGALAYAIAQRLEQLGSPPAAVVLIDSYHPRQVGLGPAQGSEATRSVGLGILEGLLAMGESSVVIDDARLTAMATYLQLVSEIEVAAIASPVLLVRAAEPIGGDASGDWRPSWDVPYDVVDAPGNHLTMMDAHAEATAEAISAWLATALGDAREPKANEGEEVHA